MLHVSLFTPCLLSSQRDTSNIQAHFQSPQPRTTKRETEVIQFLTFWHQTLSKCTHLHIHTGVTPMKSQLPATCSLQFLIKSPATDSKHMLSILENAVSTF